MAIYKVDASHSEITFKVKHMMISNVVGKFTAFDAVMESTADDFADATIRFSAQVDSITTNNEQRDGHLKSADFFDAANYPEITFVSTAFEKQSDTDYSLTGDFTLRGITHPIQLAVVYNGTMVDPYGQTKSGFEVTGKFSRKAFGLTWSAVTEAGGVVVGDEVKLELAVQMVKQA